MGTSVIVDLSVVMHLMYAKLSGLPVDKVSTRAYKDNAYLTSQLNRTLEGSPDRSSILSQMHTVGAVKAQLTWLMSLDWLGSMKPEKDAKVLLVCDSKPYWRTAYLERPEVFIPIYRRQAESGRRRKGLKGNLAKCDRLEALLAVPAPDINAGSQEWWEYNLVREEVAQLTQELSIKYKAGRKFPDPGFTRLKKAIKHYCRKSGWNVLEYHRYEADDIAAAIVATNPAENDIILATVDSDWLGLVSPNVAWFCLGGYTPRVRASIEDINQWRTRKKDSLLGAPSDLWTAKTVEGDASDNLPPGTPIEVIDLFNPPAEYDLKVDPRFLADMGASVPYEPVDSGKALEYLINIGIRPFTSVYVPEDATDGQ